jgi:sulfur-oxidizing protein SoxA
MRPRGRVLAGATLAGAVLLASVAGGQIAPGEKRSGFDTMAPETQALQSDDLANPGMLTVADGADLWEAKVGPERRSCAGCHGDAATSMRGVAARFPAWSEPLDRPVALDGQINLCRTARQGASPLAPESRELLALTTFVAHQSRGLPLTPPDDARLTPFREQGRALFQRRIGQLDLSCAQCHDDHWGRRLGGSTIPQGHSNGYPLYRLEWQAVGSLARRLRNCMTGVRAEPYAAGAPEYVDLELYLAQRAAPLAVEAPAVRP